MKKTLLRQKHCCLKIFSFLLLSFGMLALQPATAQTGQTLNFDGTDDYVNLNAPIISGSYTKEAWIYPTAAALTGFPNLISGTGTALFINNGTLAAGHSTGGFGQAVDSTGPLSANTWYHVAVTYNSATGVLLLYKNGILAKTATGVANDAETNLFLSRFAGANYFAGNMDEVRIWSTVRTGAELMASMSCQLTGDEPGLLAYYDFNQGTAGGANPTETMLMDRADVCGTHNGTLVNFALTGTTSNWIAPGAPVTGTCAGSYPNISLSGNGNCIASGSMTATDFGSYGAVPITRQFWVYNTGSATLSISSVTLTGANASDFTIVNAGSNSIAPGDSTMITVRFAPTSGAGAKMANLVITNNDPDEGTYTIMLQGTAAAAGAALDFDGVNDMVSLPFTFSGSYTKEVWIYPRVLTGFPNILSGVPGTGTALFINNGQLAAGHGPSFNQLLDPVSLVGNTWYHVAVTYDATTQILTLYKNGVAVASGTAPAYTETQQQIGAFNNSNFFNGIVDEVRYWNVARTGAEIAANYNCALSGSEAGLIAYYNFNQGAAGEDNSNVTTLNDLHGNCPMNGTLMNFALMGATSNWVGTGAPVTGSCTTQVPNISVGGNGMCILIGDATPMAGDNTYFGMIANNTTMDETFYIRNNGGETLAFTNITLTGADAGSFMIMSPTSGNVLPGDSVALVIRFAPTTTGVKNATVTITNNDADEGSYSFAIQAESLGALPVTFLYFKAAPNGKMARLVWETGAELNNAGFQVERSLNGSGAWETLGFVAGSNVSTGSTYSFNDVAPLKGYNAYRLRQVDLSGRMTYSNIDVVNFDKSESTITIYPNPVRDFINLAFNDASLLKTRATITTASGVVVSQVLLTSYRTQVDVSSLPGGLYFIKLENGNVQRILKQ